jgi:methyl-accepting chemotaxis protein
MTNVNNSREDIKAEMTAVKNDLEVLSGELKPHDIIVSSQLERLAKTLNVENGEQLDVDKWSSVDLYRLIDPRAVRERLLMSRSKGSVIRILEIIRNVILLAPVMVTWFGITTAVDGYYALIKQDPKLSQTPFLYLWQDGFNGTSITLGTLGLINFALLVIIIVITIIIALFGNRSAVSPKDADRIYQELSDVIIEVNRIFSSGNTTNRVSSLQNQISQIFRLIESERAQIRSERVESQRQFEVQSTILDNFITQLNNSLMKLPQKQELDDELKTFNDSISALTDKVAEHAKIGENIQNAAESMQRDQQTMSGNLQTIQQRLSEYASAFEKMTEQLPAMAQLLADASRNVASISPTLATASERIESSTTALSEVISEFKSSSDQFNEYVNTINASIEKHRTTTELINTASETLMRQQVTNIADLTTKLDGFGNHLIGIADNLSSVDKSLQGMFNDDIIAKMSKIAESTSTYTVSIDRISQTLNDFRDDHTKIVSALNSEGSAQHVLALRISESIGQFEHIHTGLAEVTSAINALSIEIMQRAPSRSGVVVRIPAARRRTLDGVSPTLATSGATARRAAELPRDGGVPQSAQQSPWRPDAAAATPKLTPDAAGTVDVPPARDNNAGWLDPMVDNPAPHEPAGATADLHSDRAGAEYLWVPDGSGLMGFWMMRTPVTNAMWRAAVQADAVTAPRDTEAYDDAAKAQHPVVYVSREQARAYAAWVGGRLPRDAEWTRAAQGDDGRTYPWGEAPPDATRANFGRARYEGGDTTPVGAYPAGASPYGLLDMAGNVWEWIEPNDGDDGRYIVRGGAFDDYAVAVVCSARIESDLGLNDNNVGFRVVSPVP